MANSISLDEDMPAIRLAFLAALLGAVVPELRRQ
jgi:hypothetical protein